jgi:ribonuclease R
MSTLRFPPQAIALSKALTLQDFLWQRPQVQGVTIDGPTSLDLDDAIWIEPTVTGAILSVHIADVAELVTPGSILDKVAIARTQTRYFGKGNDPMLPRALSEDKLSLVEGQARPTLTVKITLNALAEIEQTEIFESWFVSARRFSYAQADHACQTPSAKFHSLLKHCKEWTERLSKARQVSGAIGGFFSQSGYLLDENGNLIPTQGPQYHSQMVIQEFMILANRAVAGWLAERDIVALYRNHTARAIAPERTEMIQSLLTTGNTNLLRQKLQHWLNRADYSPTLIGHFALNLSAYCHFTSPIRRLADLIVHRIVKVQLRGEAHPYSKHNLEQLGKHIATVTQEYENESDEHHKSQRKEQYRTQLETPEDLGELPVKEFGRLLKYAVAQQAIESLHSEILARLKGGTLAVQDLYLLLFRCDRLELRQLAYAYLTERVQDAPSIISAASDQEEGWEGFEYVELGNGPPFTAWLEVAIAGNRFTTVQGSEHTRKQGSRHYACLAWIEEHISGALVSPGQRVQPVRSVQLVAPVVEPEQSDRKPKPMHPTLTKPLKDGQMFASLLIELCQSLRWAAPEYEFTEVEEGFCCECRISGLEARVIGSGVASKKQQAKHRAARAVLEQLQAQAGRKWDEWEAGA